PPAPAPVPPGPPLDLSGTGGDGTVSLTWKPPSSSGSFAITQYQAEASPGGAICLTASPALACLVDGLSNGTAYTFQVRALSGAGWGEWSLPSSPVTPVGPTPPAATILIVGSRGQGPNAGRVYVAGTTTGLEGERVRARVRLAGQPRYKSGVTRPVSADGTFTWQRKSKKRTYVYFSAGQTRSKRVIIPSPAPPQLD
ncbi:MAG: fibronectin type III domain-containing protein, partial [bacterium]